MEIRLLGPLEVEVDGRHVDLGPLKERTLLGVLALHANETVSTERLIDELWGASPPPSAPKLVQTYVSHLRKALPDAIETRPPGYALRVERDAVDVTRFDRLVQRAAAEPPGAAADTLREALALWRGEPLEGLVFESLAAQDVRRLEDARLAATAARIEADLALGGHDRLAGELKALVARNPYDERFRAQLMLALYRSGRQADALDVYRDAQRVLADDLGLEPGPELRQAEAAILRHEETARAPRADAPQPPRRRRAAFVAAALVVVAAAAAAAAVAWSGDAAQRRSVAVHAPALAAVDASDGTVTAVAAAGPRPLSVAATPGAVWVADGEAGTLTRLDARTLATERTIPIGNGLSSVAATGDAVWVLAATDGRLVRVDPASNRVVARISVPVRRTAFGAVAPTEANLAATRDVVWVDGISTIWKVDARTNRVVGSILPDSACSGVAVAAGALWTVDVRDSDHRYVDLQRRDPNTGQTTEHVGLAEDAAGIVSDGSDLWIAEADGTLLHVDRDASVQGSLAVGGRPVSVVRVGNAMWIADADRNELVEVSGDGSRILDRVRLAAEPAGLASDARTVWAAAAYRAAGTAP